MKRDLVYGIDGERIKALLRERSRKASSKYLAGICGLSEIAMSRVLSGYKNQYKVPDDLAERLAWALDVPVAYVKGEGLDGDCC